MKERAYKPELFGSRLRSMRKQLGITQRELAESAGLETTHLAHFETGRRLPSLVNFCALMAAFRSRSTVSIEYFLGASHE